MWTIESHTKSKQVEFSQHHFVEIMFSLNVPLKYSKTVYDTIHPLYISSRLFGFLPFSATITKPSSNRIYLTKVDHLIFIIHELVYILCTVFNSNVKMQSNVSSSKLIVDGMKYQIVFGCFVCCVIVIVERVFRTFTWNIVEAISDFDVKVFPCMTRVMKRYKSSNNFFFISI